MHYAIRTQVINPGDWRMRLGIKTICLELPALFGFGSSYYKNKRVPHAQKNFHCCELLFIIVLYLLHASGRQGSFALMDVPSISSSSWSYTLCAIHLSQRPLVIAARGNAHGGDTGASQKENAGKDLLEDVSDTIMKSAFFGLRPS
ncbi:uncharacterized protein LOC144292837 [Canis aureus]